MKPELKFFKKSKSLPIDIFFSNVLYDKKFGYYTSKNPFGKKGDFITAPKISNLFSEMIAIWIISTWEMFGKPERINLVELGPGDASLIKVLLEVFKRFPKFDNAKKVYLYEKSIFLEKKQKQNLKINEVEWIRNFQKIKNGPVIFFGNEFFDAIPIKQFKKKNNLYLEKYYAIKDKKIKVLFKSALKDDIKLIKSFNCLKKLKFIEFPKLGLKELHKIIKRILKLNGCILLIDYGFLKSNNLDTLQSVKNHRKNSILKNLGKADITSKVNFDLLKEYFLKNNLKVKSAITQKKFLENLGIIERSEIVAKKMSFREKTNLYLRLKRLLSPKLMGELFKAILAYKFKNDNYFGF